MKKIRMRNVRRNIGASMNRFLSIAAIVALGTGFLAGLVSTTPDMEDAADEYMDKVKWYDIDVKNTLGFSKEDVKKLSSVKGIDEVSCAYVTDNILVSEQNTRYTARIFGYLGSDKNNNQEQQVSQGELNSFLLVSGRLPEKPDECVVQSPNGYTTTLPANGSTLVFLNNTTGYAYRKLTVTGVVQSPMFISAESEPSLKGSGSITLGVYVQRNFYTLQSYTDVYMTVKGASKLSTWSKEYKQLVAEVALELKKITAGIVEEKVASVEEAGKMTDGALNNIQVIKNKLLLDEKYRVSQSEKLLSLLRSVGGTKNEMLIENISSTAERVKTAEKNDIDALPIQTMDIIDEEISLMKKEEDRLWSVDTRDNNVGYASYLSNIEKIQAMSRIFPVFFYFIAMLVSLTTMTRLVEERRNEMGVLKALGFSDGALLGEYLLYAFLATVLGSVVGLSIGFKLFPAVISNAYGMMYSLPKVATPVRWNVAIICSGIAVLCIMVATLAACLSQTIGTPASLMTAKAPSPGKRILLERISFLWKRIPFSGKVTARNIFRYKKRLYMTVAGIAGCSALLVTGFGLHDSIYDIVNKQFGEINKYDLTVMFSKEDAVDTDNKLKAFFNDASTVNESMKFSTENGYVINGDEIQPTTINVPQQPQLLSHFITLRERRSHDEIPFTNEGVVLTEKLCEQLGVKKGDKVVIQNADGVKAEATVLGGAENYVYAYVYMYPETYSSCFHKDPCYSSALCKLSEQRNNDAVVEKLMESPKVLYVLSTAQLTQTAFDTMRSINVVVIVLIIASGLLSMIVLYNLANINICERKREIATLLVLGYTEHESRRYIFREIDFLSFIGIALGLLLGVPLHGFIVKTLEVNAAMWGRTIYPLSFLYAAGISILFTFGVNIIMRKSIHDIDMVESMKIVD